MVAGKKSSFTRAKSLLEQGEYARAASAFEEAAKEVRPQAALFLGWADALIADRRPEAALTVYEQAAAAVGDDVSLLVAWGSLLFGMSMPEQARWRFERALELDGRQIAAYLGSGNALLALDLPQEAADRFQYVAEELDGDSESAWSGWGRACLAKEDYEQALEKLKRARELQPESIDHLLDIGAAFAGLERFTESLGAYREAMALERRFSSTSRIKYRTRISAARASLAIYEPDEALQYCEEGLRILAEVGKEKSVEAAVLHFFAGASLAVLKSYGEAIASFRCAAKGSEALAIYATNAISTVLAAQGNYTQAWTELRLLVSCDKTTLDKLSGGRGDARWLAYGTALLWLERFSDAEKVFKDFVAARPRQASGWAKLVELYLEWCEECVEDAPRRRWQANDAYRKAVSLLERRLSAARTAGTVIALAQLHFRMDDLDAAESLFREATELEPASPVAFAGLGMVMVKRSEHALGIEQFELALRRDADNLTLRCHLADAYARLDRLEASLDIYSDVIRIAPGNVGAQIGAGEILLEQAESSNDDTLLEDAEVHFSTAIVLATSVRSGVKQEGSTGLGVRHWAGLHYARGYVRAKIYEAQMSEVLGRTPTAARQKLVGALEDFVVAKETGINAHMAERGATRVRERLKRISSAGLTESYAPLVIAISALVVLVTVQIGFFVDESFSKHLGSSSYTVLTTSLLVLAAIGFYLPQVLKLKLGGIEVEKSTTQVSQGATLNLAHEPLPGGLHASFTAEVSEDLKSDRGETPVVDSRGDAQKGASPDAGGGEVREAQQYLGVNA